MRLRDDRGVYRKMSLNELNDEFDSLIKKEECWIWTGIKTVSGYPILAGKYMHRYSYERYRGPIGGMHVLHKCDNPSCVNPAHLFLGTQQDNNNDKLQKGRAKGGSMKGESHPSHKITANDVIAIRQKRLSGETQTAIAKEYGISQGQVWAIVTMRNWAHV